MKKNVSISLGGAGWIQTSCRNVTEAEGAQSNIFVPFGIAALKFHERAMCVKGFMSVWCSKIV